MFDGKHKLLVITADNGCHAEAVGYSTSGMYGDPEQYFAECEEGAYVLDQRTVPENSLVRAVLRAPLVDVKLEPNAIDRLAGKDIVDSWMCQAMMCEPGNDFGHILKHELLDAERRPERRFGSLDKVGLGHYLEYWAEHGARVGQIANGEVIWLGESDEPQ
jgi:hypothetical protein